MRYKDFFVFVVFSHLFPATPSSSVFFHLISKRPCGNPGVSTQENYIDRGKAKHKISRDIRLISPRD